MPALPPSPRAYVGPSSGDISLLWPYLPTASPDDVEAIATATIDAFTAGQRDDYETAHIAVGLLWFARVDAGVRVGALVRTHGRARMHEWVRWRALASWMVARELPPPEDPREDPMRLLGFGLDGPPPLTGSLLGGALDIVHRVLRRG